MRVAVGSIVAIAAVAVASGSDRVATSIQSAIAVGAPEGATGSYTVVPGDSLYGIAGRTATPIGSLLSLNGLALNSIIHPGHVLYTAAAATAAPVPPAGGGGYTVVRGDTLSGISRKTGTPIGTLLSLNGLQLTSLIFPGQVLTVGGSAPSPGTPAPAPGGTTYTVVRGDSLYGISRRTGTPFDTLLSLNGLRRSSIIHPGQVLQISGTAPTPSPGTPAPGGGSTYTIVAGDTLSGISRTTGTPLSTLLSLNGLQLTSIIHPGQVLNVAGPAEAPAQRIIEQRVVGTTRAGRSIVAYRLGTLGGLVVLAVGNLHGHEQAGITIAERLRDITAIAPGIDLWVITTANPDGTALGARTNGNGVDLNRNFSVNWAAVDCSAFPSNCAGSGPASEPETQALQAFILEIRPVVSVWWHGSDNAVASSVNNAAAGAYAGTAGMAVRDVPCRPSCTGTATQYSNANVAGSAFVVELPTSARFGLSATAMDRHIRAFFAAIAAS